MADVIALFARTYLIGVAVAAPVGAMGVLCIQRTLAFGWRAGVATGLGIATADAFYAGLAAFGVASISSQVVAWQTPLQIIGGLILVFIGLASLLRKPAEKLAAVTDEAVPGHGGLYLSSVGLTLTNPMTIMAFAAVFASAGLVEAPGLLTAAISTIGVALGSLSWWVALISGVALVRRGLSGGAVAWVGRISGAAVAGFGVFALVTALL